MLVSTNRNPRRMSNRRLDETRRNASRDELVESSIRPDEHGEVEGWGRDPKKCTGRDWGMGSSTI